VLGSGGRSVAEKTLGAEMVEGDWEVTGVEGAVGNEAEEKSGGSAESKAECEVVVLVAGMAGGVVEGAAA